MSKCNICRKEITPLCDWQQGRCPHRKIPIGKAEKSILYVALIVLIFIILGVASNV